MNTYSVLILDDEEFSVDVLMEDIHWEKCGISQVHGVYSVRQAKEFLKKNAVNILICDIEMPGENGLDLVEWAMEYARFSKDPMICIMLTCHPENHSSSFPVLPLRGQHRIPLCKPWSGAGPY